MERSSGRSDDVTISNYCWLVEAFRTQLFAQPLKTRQAVSQKWLEKL